MNQERTEGSASSALAAHSKDANDARGPGPPADPTDRTQTGPSHGAMGSRARSSDDLSGGGSRGGQHMAGSYPKALMKLWSVSGAP